MNLQDLNVVELDEKEMAGIDSGTIGEVLVGTVLIIIGVCL